MPLLHIVILALVQGITEFLPVSSSGHLVLVHALLDESTTLEVQQTNLMLDIAVHVGTLVAVLVYFRCDVLKMFMGLKDLACGKTEKEGAKLDILVLLGSLPVIAAGFFLYLYEPHWLRNVEVVAWTTLLFGILLWLVDAYKPSQRTLKDMGWKDALIIGFAQILALVPGTSRSGITMTAGRYLGYTRSEAAHFSLLLAIVAISGAGLMGGISLVETRDISLTFDVFLAALLAFLSAWIAIALMMKWLSKASFAPFAIYRIILGLVLLAFVYNEHLPFTP